MSERTWDILRVIALVVVALVLGYFLALRGAQSERSQAEAELRESQAAVREASQAGSGQEARAARRATQPISAAEIRTRLQSAAGSSGVQILEISPGSRTEATIRGSGNEVLDFAADLQSDLKLSQGGLKVSKKALLVISVDSTGLPEARVTVIPASSLR